MPIVLKRAYERPAESDGYRVLVERLWPRGVAKADARLDDWLKEVAPSPALRRWFAHDPAKWDEFKLRYYEELADRELELSVLREKAARGTVTFVFGSRETRYNNAVALREYLER